MVRAGSNPPPPTTLQAGPRFPWCIRRALTLKETGPASSEHVSMLNATCQSGRVAEHHLADLRRSGLSEATITAAGFYSMTAAEVHKLTGMDAGPGLAIPYPDALFRDGSPYVRVRLDRPLPMGDKGHDAKYLTRKGEAPRLYVPPSMPSGWQDDPKLRLLLTEGEKKALAATQFGFPVWGSGACGPGWRRADARSRFP